MKLSKLRINGSLEVGDFLSNECEIIPRNTRINARVKSIISGIFIGYNEKTGEPIFISASINYDNIKSNNWRSYQDLYQDKYRVLVKITDINREITPVSDMIDNYNGKELTNDAANNILKLGERVQDYPIVYSCINHNSNRLTGWYAPSIREALLVNYNKTCIAESINRLYPKFGDFYGYKLDKIWTINQLNPRLAITVDFQTGDILAKSISERYPRSARIIPFI